MFKGYNMRVNALNLFLKQQRFDLIFKYLYASNPTEYNKGAYLDNIRAFNNFYELNPSDGVPKNSAIDFIKSFDKLYNDIKQNKFDKDKGLIPIGKNGEITDGAHRLSICAALNNDVELIDDDQNEENYPYSFFSNRRMKREYMDYGALEYVKLNYNAYIVNIHSVVDLKYDNEIEGLLNKYGFIYYKKYVHLNLNAYVHLKRISYGYFWERDSQWIGNKENHFSGAQSHAINSIGKFPLRAYVFICENISSILKVKQEIRELVKKGNYSVHINDTHEEAICLAETYFNKNTLSYIKNVPFYYEDREFDEKLDRFKQILSKNKLKIDDVSLVGSTPLNVYGIRKSDDIDYLSIDEQMQYEDSIFSPHDSQLSYYPYNKEQILSNPNFYFYYRGLKFITLDVLFKMKLTRHEVPKDFKDLYLILYAKYRPYWYFIKKFLFKNKITKHIRKLLR